MNVPITKNGPNGISLFKLFFLPVRSGKTINIKPIIAPKKKAKNKAVKIFGNPNKIPIKRANFTSPKPIAMPLENKNIIKKNPDAIAAASR